MNAYFINNIRLLEDILRKGAGFGVAIVVERVKVLEIL